MIILCEKTADISNPIENSKSGVHFSIPGHWIVTEDEDNNDFRYIFIESPGDAIFMVEVYRYENPFSLKEYVDLSVEEYRNDFYMGKVNRNTFSEINIKAAAREWDGIRNQFSVKVMGIEVPHVQDFYAIESESRVAYLSSQVAEEDFEKVSDGFELILKSFRFD